MNDFLDDVPYESKIFFKTLTDNHITIPVPNLRKQLFS